MTAVALTTLMVGFVGIATGSAATKHAAKPIKPDFAFFAGKQITYIVPQSVGGSYSPPLLPAVPIVQNYLHATINVIYVPQASSIVGQDQIAGSAPDGLTIGTMSVSADLPQVIQGNVLVNFNIQKQSLIGGVYVSPVVIVACNHSPYTTIKQVMHATTPFQTINSGQGLGYEFIKVLFGSYHAPMVSLSGYSTTAAQVSACLGGDAPLALLSLTSLTPADFQQGLVHGLVMPQPQKPSSQFYPYLKDTPTLAKFLKQEPPTTPAGKVAMPLLNAQYGLKGLGGMIAGPAGIPKARLLALQKAFEVAGRSAAVRASVIAAGQVPGYVLPAAVGPFFKRILKHQAILGRFMNS